MRLTYKSPGILHPIVRATSSYHHQRHPRIKQRLTQAQNRSWTGVDMVFGEAGIEGRRSSARNDHGIFYDREPSRTRIPGRIDIPPCVAVDQEVKIIWLNGFIAHCLSMCTRDSFPASSLERDSLVHSWLLWIVYDDAVKCSSVRVGTQGPFPCPSHLTGPLLHLVPFESYQ